VVVASLQEATEQTSYELPQLCTEFHIVIYGITTVFLIKFKK
jgi:hypothetical protein